jgi:hypothetical protein
MVEQIAFQGGKIEKDQQGNGNGNAAFVSQNPKPKADPFH